MRPATRDGGRSYTGDRLITAATLSELLNLAAVQRSFIALALASVGLPIAGVLIVGLDIITARFAVMHLALLGIALGLFMGIDPVLAAIAVATLCTGALAPLAARPGGLSGPMGFLMTVAIAGALLVLSITGVNATGAFELLWGSVLATRWRDLIVIGVISTLVAGFVLRFRQQLALTLHDRELALMSGVRVDALLVATLMLVAAAISSSIRLTGALLVDSLTLLPALAARNVAKSFTSMLWWAMGIGLIANVVGLFVSLATDQPPGPILVLTVGTVTLATFVRRSQNQGEI